MNNELLYKYIEQLMAQGKADPKIRGWDMQDILKKVANKFGYSKVEDARKIIVSRSQEEYKRLNPTGWEKSFRNGFIEKF